ncbi:MAG: MYG1 family protein, partial [Fibrobacterota bacterium]
MIFKQGYSISYNIITHNGKAHIDEILGSALLAIHLNEEPSEIQRINSQEVARMVEAGEIPENTYVIDTGLMFDSDKRLFDHHQNGESPCTALLIFNEYFSNLNGTELHDYIKLVSKVDTQGLISLNDYHIVSESNVYWSFTQTIIESIFEVNPMLVLKIMIDGVREKIAFAKMKKLASIWRNEPDNIEIVSVDSIKILTYLKKPPSEIASALKSELNAFIDKNEVSV